MTTTTSRGPTAGPARRGLTWVGLLGATALLVVACNGDDGEAATAEAEPTEAPVAEVTEAPAEPTVAPADPTEAPAAEASDDDVDPAEAAASAAAAAIAALDFGDGTASVVLDGETIEFSLGSSTDAAGNPQTGVCREAFGIIQAAGYATDGRDIEFDAMIPPTDWETYEDGRYDAPSVRLEIADGNRNLVADADQAAEFGYEGSAVTEFESDGSTASGSASFVDTWKPADDPARAPVSGTFRVACAN